MQLDIALGSGVGASFGSKLVTTVGCGPAAASLPAAARRCFAAALHSNVYIYIYIHINIYIHDTYTYIYIYIVFTLCYVMLCCVMLCYNITCYVILNDIMI